MKKLIIASICVALGVVLSTTSIPVGPARIFPFQHMINVILAVVVGGKIFRRCCL
nr:energy coupling factor transporter S component ThiW [Veillonella rogosae]